MANLIPWCLPGPQCLTMVRGMRTVQVLPTPSVGHAQEAGDDTVSTTLPGTTFMDTGLPIWDAPPYRVADLSADTVAWGRSEMSLAEDEMPGLMSLRLQYRDAQPLAGARITGSLHMTIQTAVLIETLVHLGASVRWASCNIFSTQDHAAAAVVVGPDGTPDAPSGVPVFAWKGETHPEYWWCTFQALHWGGDEAVNLLIDDGGDATLLLHLGADREGNGPPSPASAGESPDEMVIRHLLDQVRDDAPTFWTGLCTGVRGVSEETTTGVSRLYQRMEEGTLLFPGINVNNSVTKSKFDNLYGCRHSLVDGIMRATDVMLAGKLAVICGYGDVGKGCAQSLTGQKCRVVVTEIDPICALQACMDGFQVVQLEDVVEDADLFITATGNLHVINAGHMARMKDKAIVGNIGHFDNEIDMRGLEDTAGVRMVTIKPQTDQWIFPDGHSVIVLAEGRLLNLGCATGHPSFVMSTSFSNQVLAQMHLHAGHLAGERTVTTLPKVLDEEVARLHLDKLNARLTTLSTEQAEYIGIPAAGPYKPEFYRY